MPYKHDDKETKCVVSFEYPCYICGYIMSKPKTVIDHVKRIHGYEIPTRHVGHKRPPDTEFDYQNNPKGEFDVQHYSCASCWFHCPESGLAELQEHYNTSHKPKNVDPSKNEEKPQMSSTTPEHYVRTDMETDDSPEQDVGEEGSNSKSRRSSHKHEKEPFQAVDASDIMGKLNELTDLFKSLLK